MKKVLLCLLLTTLSLVFNRPTGAEERKAADAGKTDGASGADWLSYGGTHSAWRFSSLDQIKATNVKKLAPVWMFQTGDYQDGLQSTPIVVNGVLYLSAPNDDVFALNGATGALIWQYKYQPAPGSRAGRMSNRGVAVADGKVFIGTNDGRVVALDQKTGQEVWKVAADDASACQCNIAAPPLVVKDKVIIGAGGPRGRVTAFDVKTGRLRWRFYAIPGPGEKGNETWAGDSWRYGGGNSYTVGSYDPELNLLYWPVGDPSPAFNGSQRAGANLYTDSIVALNPDTGQIRWYYQEIPHDVWDYDATWEIVLMDREVRGRMRKLLVHFNKGGFTFVLDRETGELLAAYPYVENYNWVKTITPQGELVGRNDTAEGKVTPICPSNVGAKSWNQTAYSPRTGLIYVPVLEMCNDITLHPPRGNMRDPFAGTWTLTPPPGHESAYSHLDALDPVSGKRRWTYFYRFELMASILATAGDVIFTGDPEGNFFALDARTGEKLWNFQSGGGHRGSPVTYLAGGKQYIATPTGWAFIGGITSALWPESKNWRLGSTLVVFALPEGAK